MMDKEKFTMPIQTDCTAKNKRKTLRRNVFIVFGIVLFIVHFENLLGSVFYLSPSVDGCFWLNPLVGWWVVLSTRPAKLYGWGGASLSRVPPEKASSLCGDQVR